MRRRFVRGGASRWTCWPDLIVVCGLLPVFLGVRPGAFAGTCGTDGQLCNTNAACDDGNPCNGAETCSPPDIIRFCRCDPTPPCDDGNPCTLDSCTDTPRGVTCEHGPAGCSDGRFCNGLETCLHSSSCMAGTPPCLAPLLCDEANDRCVECLADDDCADAIACTTDACNVAAGSCENTWCMDGMFCNGRELCGACASKRAPCVQTDLCDEAADRCADCTSDLDCVDDGDPCTVETCDTDWLTCRTAPCSLSFDAPPDQAVFPIGEPVDLVGRGPRGLDLVLVLDESGSIAPADFVALKEFARALVEGLPFLSDGTAARVGVVMFSSGSRRVLSLNGNKQLVINTILSIQQRGGFTCIGCGIDDGADELIADGPPGATWVMIVLTDGQNNLPAGPDLHLAGALEAAAFHGITIFAIGVGGAVLDTEIERIASDVPGVQTAYYAFDFTFLQTVILNALFIGLAGPYGANNVYTVDLTLPDGADAVALVDPTGNFTVPQWAIMPGENRFTARIGTYFGPKTASLRLTGVYPCEATCGDLNGDGSVNLRDFAQFTSCFFGRSWHSPVCGCGDLNGDTRIDMADFAAMIAALENPAKTVPPDCPGP